MGNINEKGMKVCPRCGTLNVNEARYCKRCGFYIEKVCVNCGYLNRPEANFCARCGSPLGILCPRCRTVNPYEARYCKRCGYPLFSQTIRIPTYSATRTITPQNAPTIKLPTYSATRHIENPQQITLKVRNETTTTTRKELKKRIKIISVTAIIITALVLISLVLSGISVHYTIYGARPLSTTEINNVLGGNWVATSPVFTDNISQIEHIIHRNITGATCGYYQFFGYSSYNLLAMYINFTSDSSAKAFYNSFPGTSTVVNTYPAKIILLNNAITGIALFGKWVIYIEIYSVKDNVSIPYTSSQLEKLISYMEVT